MPNQAAWLDRKSKVENLWMFAECDQLSLFDNAIESIQIGVEDFNNEDDRRLVSAVRNIHAGILLLCKEKLRQISPEDNILLYKQYIPKLNAENRVEIVPSGKNTVDVQQIKDRFREFDIPFDWKPLDAISHIRNQIEHSHLDGPRNAVRELLSSAQVVILTNPLIFPGSA